MTMAVPARPIHGIERAARVLHARSIARDRRLSGAEVIDTVEREVAPTLDALVEATNTVLQVFEGLDAAEEPERHTADMPMVDIVPLYSGVAGALGNRLRRHVIVVCSHRRPIEEAPDWCLARGQLLLIADRRATGGHPDR